MNRTVLTVMLVLLGAAAFAAQMAEQEIVTQGEIVAVSAEEKTLTIEETAEPGAELAPDARQSGVQREFLVNESTKLTIDGEPIELGDVGAGSMAVVHYVMDAGKNVALEIEVRSPATE